MSGKYLKCFIAISLLLSFSQLVYGNQSIVINNHYIEDLGKDQIIGLRYKAIGDLLIKKKAYSIAIKYYENAIKYLPEEAEIFFKLGEIYYIEKVYEMAIRYYQLADKYYLLSQNINKPSKEKYITLIHLGISYEQIDDKIACRLVAKRLREQQKDIDDFYPELNKELNAFYKRIYGEYGIFLEE